MGHYIGRAAHRWIAAMAISLFLGGCGGPTDTTRDNRRLVEAILTAVTIRSTQELANDKILLEARREEGDLSEATANSLLEIIEFAETGDWAKAEQELYQLRKRVPFPK